jgi:hypothetical protein
MKARRATHSPGSHLQFALAGWQVVVWMAAVALSFVM